MGALRPLPGCGGRIGKGRTRDAGRRALQAAGGAYQAVAQPGVFAAGVPLAGPRPLPLGPNQSRPMASMFDAHVHGFRVFGGVSSRAIYDSEAWPRSVRGQTERRRQWIGLAEPRSGRSCPVPGDGEPLCLRARGLQSGPRLGERPGREECSGIPPPALAGHAGLP